MTAPLFHREFIRARRLAAAAGVLLAAATAVFGQASDQTPVQPPGQPPAAAPEPATTPPVDTHSDPVFNSEGVDELTIEMLKRRPAPPPVRPVRSRVRVVVPPDIGQATNPFIGVDAGGLGTARAELLPEGAFLVRRRGSVIKSDSGDWVFLAHPDALGAAERAMVLLPSPGLAQIEDDLTRAGPDAVCYLSGQVFQYRWSNYILPTAFNVTTPAQLAPAAPATLEPATSEPPTPQPADPGPEADPAPADDQPPQPASADSVIRDLEQRRARPRSISRPTPPVSETTPSEPAPAASAGESAADAAPGVTLISERRARVMRLADGRLALAFDRGFSPGPESTMPLLECAALQRLESQSLSRGDAAVFAVTGRGVPYRGRTYFLLAGFHQAAPSDVASLQ